MSCNATCIMPMSSGLMQQSDYYSSCNESKLPRKMRKSGKIKKSKCGNKRKVSLDCDNNFTPSGMKPEKTAGALSSEFCCCAKYAPCGCWENCNRKDHVNKNCFEGYAARSSKAPFGPYGPWTKLGPSQFKTTRPEYIKRIYPLKSDRSRRDGLAWTSIDKDEPMGKMRPWPLSGSCRYAGRPYGPCRPSGAFRSRGPFGIWMMAGDNCDFIGRPDTPAQPCWMPSKPGYRPCTPCQRPLFRPCKGKCLVTAECNYVEMTKSQATCDEK